MITNWTKDGCKPVEVDQEIEHGDFVAEMFGNDRSTGIPGKWVRALFSVGMTPREASVFACRPINKQDTKD